jgi:hypothetical protein
MTNFSPAGLTEYSAILATSLNSFHCHKLQATNPANRLDLYSPESHSTKYTCFNASFVKVCGEFTQQFPL